MNLSINQPLKHLGGYHFFEVADPQGLQKALMAFLAARDIRGTFLLAHEGLNFNVTGPAKDILQLRDFVNAQVNDPQMIFHEWPVDRHCFAKVLVKVKKEIVTMGDPHSVHPKKRAQYISPEELKSLLSNPEDIFLLDTRNQFEFDAGKFHGAQCLGNASFGEFATMARALPPALKKKKVVMYCTGGIRCEKAGHLFLDQLGFEHVYQLHGGILNYFKRCGSEYFDGECFVFDDRRHVRGNLEP